MKKFDLHCFPDLGPAFPDGLWTTKNQWSSDGSFRAVPMHISPGAPPAFIGLSLQNNEWMNDKPAQYNVA